MPSRPYEPDTAIRICAELTEGRSLRSVCKDEGMPAKSTVFKWLADVPEFAELYRIAMEQRTEAHVEECLDIADDGSNDWIASNDPDNPGYRFNGEHYQRSRLRVETRKWIACKMKPKKYGDKVSTEITGADGGPVRIVAQPHDENV